MIALSSHTARAQRLTGRLMLCLALLAPFDSAATPGDDYHKSDVEVALLYKVIKFVRWPEGNFASEGSPLRVCVYPSDEYRKSIEALEQRSVRSHPLQVVQLEQGATIAESQCHLVFFTSPAQLGNGNNLRGIEDQPVLTVGNFREFTERGGMLSLARARNRIQLRIDAGVSKRAGLQYNAQLLELATVLNRS